VWLHDIEDCVADEFTARNLGAKALAIAEPGDILVPVTTGWNWPAHAGIIFTMMQDMIRAGTIRVINVCNMKEKAPGYVGQRANVLFFEILGLPYECLTIIDQSEAGWAEFSNQIGQVLSGTYKLEAPYDLVRVDDSHRKTAKEALAWLRKNVGFVKLVNVASMTMVQGWPNVEQFLKIGAVPVFVGSHEFEEEMDAVPQSEVDEAYAWLKGTGVKIEYRPHGLSRKEIDLALRMLIVKVNWINKGCMGIGTQGQMEQIRKVATDISESIIMGSWCYGKKEQVPNIDVTETDCDALFTSLVMQAIMFVKTGKMLPVGFHDIRHYCIEEDTLVLLNSGALAPDFLVDSMDDWSDVHLVSQNRDVYFLKGGAAVCGNMRPVTDATLARFHGKGGSYKLLCSRMNILPLDWDKRRKVYGKLDAWPMGLAKIPAPMEGQIVTTLKDMTPTLAATLKWVPNHGQHSNMLIVPELVAVADELGLEHQCFAS
jgi:hypothetical protein